MNPGPAHPLVRLLRRLWSRAAADAAIGDAVEELQARMAEGRTPRWAALWLNLWAIRMIAAVLVAGAPRHVRAAGLAFRDATRGLRAAPAHALAVIGVLAIAVTAGTITFSVVDAVLLKSLPIERPDQVVTIALHGESGTQRVTPELYWQLREHLRSVDSLATRMTLAGSPVAVGTLTDEWPVTFASAGIFRVLRWSPAIGRLWTPEEEARGETDVAVLGHRFWRQHFGGQLSALGEIVTLGKQSYRVIGVLPAESDHPELDLTSTPIWVPYAVPRTAPANPFGVIARMPPGVSAAQVAEEITRLNLTPGAQPIVSPLLDGYLAPVRSWMLLALGAATLVVLIGCVNAANLMLTRSAVRAQEMAIRASLGASRRQVAAGVLIEGLLLASAATACALLLSTAGVQAARTAITTMLPGTFRASAIALNGRVLAAAIAAAAITGVLVSIVPAWQTSRVPVASLLKDGDATSTTGRRRWRSVFLVAEVATVVVLLVASWLFLGSLIRAVNVDLGIDRTNLLAVKPRLPFQGTVDEVRQRLEDVPGVSGVAVSTGASLPFVGRAFGGAWHTRTVEPVSEPAARDGAALTVLDYRVTANYFDVAGLRFLRGTAWTAEMESGTPPVVLDTRAVHHLFGDADPIGRQVRVSDPDGIFTVVGTVPYVRAWGPEEEVWPAAYFPNRLNSNRVFAALFVKTSRPAADMLPLVTDALRPFAPQTKDPFVFAADDALRRLTARRRFNAGLMSAFGIVGLLIGVAGVYAVMASFVAQQRREIGVRVALGASPGRIQREVLALASRHMVAGLVIGLPIAWWLSRGFAALLFQVSPADVTVYAGVACLLCAAGWLAAWIPACHAGRIDPITALRR